MTLHAPSVPHDTSRHLQEGLRIAREEALASADEAFPLFAVYTAMQQDVEQLDDEIVTAKSALPAAVEQRPACPITLKQVMIWSHHLLATGKRKLIVQVCSSLSA